MYHGWRTDADVDRPNILFVMSDDHAAHAIGAYGGRLAPLDPTPTLDRLAAEGMVLENRFCNNSVCSPSRASILTGRYSHVNGVRSLGGKVPEEHQAKCRFGVAATIPSCLKRPALTTCPRRPLTWPAWAWLHGALVPSPQTGRWW